jgi:pimeloyl-ACP methyl ester carboxylesterase
VRHARFGTRRWRLPGAGPPTTITGPRPRGRRAATGVPQQSMFAIPRLRHFPSLGPSGFHRVAYTEWGSSHNPHVVICVHGLTRNSRDFDYLAAALAPDCRVICMDVAGRGRSDWLPDKSDYGFALYQSEAAALLAHVMARSGGVLAWLAGLLQGLGRPRRIDWVGTSMGGMIGMILAAKAGSPVGRLVLNDVGPLVPWSGLVRLKNVNAGLNAKFKNLGEAEQHLRAACAAFGPLSDRKWRQVTRHSARRNDDGTYSLAYDPGIVSAIRRGNHGDIEFGGDFLQGVDLWPEWERIKCPTLVLRGAESDLLLAATAKQMTERGPRARLVEFPGIGHAPWLMTDDQVGVVREFLVTR